MKRSNIGFIGFGNMARAISDGITENRLNYTIRAYDPIVNNYKNVVFSKDGKELVQSSDFVFLSIKPQMAEQALSGIDFGNKIIISIMAGIDISRIKSLCSNSEKIVRVMPNLCARIGKATNAFTCINLTDEETNEVKAILDSFGKSFNMDEKFFDTITGLTGSSPAYTFRYLMDNIICALDNGFDFELAKELVINTAISSAYLLNNCTSIDEMKKLIDSVCSKGGTTIEGIKKLDEMSFDTAVISSVNAAIARSKELSGSLPTVNIYTDGACSGNPGKGGWAAILISGDYKKEISGAEENTTNNRMELKAVIEGLKMLKKTCYVNVYSDSSYVVNAFNEKWIDGWIKKAWSQVKNVDLWKELFDLTRNQKITFIKVKGQSDNIHNNRCDELAVSMCK